jgi:hypothetical protein
MLFGFAGYDYLFEIAVSMRQLGVDFSKEPSDSEYKGQGRKTNIVHASPAAAGSKASSR